MTCSLDTVKRGSVDHIHLAWCCYGQVYISFQDMWTTLILLHRDGNNLTPMMPWAFTLCIYIYTNITHIHYNTYTHTLLRMYTYTLQYITIHITIIVHILIRRYIHNYTRTHAQCASHTQTHRKSRALWCFVVRFEVRILLYTVI